MGLFDTGELETALNAAKVGVWSWQIDSDELRWSPEVTELFGLPKEPFLGVAEDFFSRVFADDRQMVRDKVQVALEARQQDYAVEYRYYAANDEVRWMTARGRVELGPKGEPASMIGAVFDTTERREAMEEASQREEQYRLFSELASDYIYVVDMQKPTMAPMIVAGSFERTTSYTPEDVESRGGWLELMHPDDRHNVEPLVAALNAGKSFVNEYRIVDRNGQVRWLRDRAFPTLENGKLVRITGGVQDITERKGLEEQLGRAQKMEALARLAGGVAHDLNNLLTVMYAATGLLRPEAKSDRASRALDDMKKATERASDLTRALLLFGRKDEGNRRQAKLESLPQQFQSVLRRAAGERVDLVIESNAGDASVSVDIGQLELALLNLVINARDAMGENGGVVRIRCRSRHFAADDMRRPAELAAGNYGLIEVEDTGNGIAPDLLQRVFEPFFSTKPSGKGTGLGLATVHGIVRQHEGAVTVSSVVGKGSTFTISLPLSTGEADTAAPPDTHRAIGGNERVLIIEDEDLVRRMAERILTDLGYRVMSAGSVEEAMPMGDDFDLILTDVRLPGMSGAHYATRLRDQGSKAAIILTTGYVEHPEQRAILESGQFPVLNKPFTADGLLRRVRDVLEQRGG